MSIRLELTEGNMDLVMYLVRVLDENPSEVINKILSGVINLKEARSVLNDNKKVENTRVTCKKR